MSNKSFISSPVLQEFYKKALDKKWFKEEVSLVKKASAPISISSDLEQNIMTLASHLNSINMKKEATELVNNFFSYKQAASQFSELIDQQSRSMLEFAHRDDKELFPTTSGLGKIHNNLERQRKIIETLNHQPKLAVAEELYKVFKIAQTTGEPLDSQLEKADSKEKNIDGAEELELEFDEKSKENIKAANEKLDALKTSFSEAVTAFYQSLTIPEENFSISLAKLNNPTFAGAFATFTKTDLGELLKFVRKWVVVSSGDSFEVSKESISAMLNKFSNDAAGYNGLLGWVKAYVTAPEIANQFASGSYYKAADFTGLVFNKELVSDEVKDLALVPFGLGGKNELGGLNDPHKGRGKIIAETATTNPILVLNPSSLWTVKGTINKDSKDNAYAEITEFSKNESLGLLADDILKKFQNEWAAMLSAEKIAEFKANATKSLQSKFDITSLVTAVNELPPIKKSTSYTLQVISTVNSKLSSYGEYISKLLKSDNEFYYLNQLTNVSVFLGNVGKLRSILQKGTEELAKIQITSADSVVPDEELSSMQSEIATSRSLLGMYYKQNKDKLTQEQVTQLISQKNTLEGLLAVVSKKETPSTFAVIKQQIQSNPSLAWLPISNLDSLKAWISSTKKNYLAAVKIKESSLINNIIKQADGMSLPGAPAAKAPAGSGNVGSQKAGPAKELTEGKKAVQRMQALLINLGNTLNTRSDRSSYSTAISKLFLVGKNSTDPNSLDGAWGPNTANALKAAKEFKDAAAVEVGPFMNIDEGQLKEKATKNSELIASTIRTLGGSVADTLSNVKGTVLTKIGPGLQQGETALTTESLNSLKDFNKFLAANKIFPENQGGFTVDQWINDIFAGLYQLVSDLYANASLSVKQNSKVLANMWKNLATEFNRLVKSFNIDVNSDEGKSVLLDAKSLENLPLGGTSLSDMRSGKVKPGDPMSPGNTNMEGITFDSGSPESTQVPFDGTKLVVSSDYFPLANQLYKGSLIYDLMNKEQAVNTASRLFSNADISAESLQILFFNLNAHALANLRNDNGVLTAELAGKGRLPIANMPKYQQSAQMLANLYPVLQYRQFLWNLKKEMTSASQKFQQAQPNLAEQIQLVHSRWVVLIEKHLEQLQNFLSR